MKEDNKLKKFLKQTKSIKKKIKKYLLYKKLILIIILITVYFFKNFIKYNKK